MGHNFSHDYQIEPFSKAFDRGNYASAYESQEWIPWRYEPDQLEIVAERCGVAGSPSAAQAIEAGLALGFFSSYEDHEIPDDLREWVSALRKLNAKLAEAAGIALA